MDQEPLTLSVPEAGKRYFGLSRGASYEAAHRGELPTIRIGRLIRVPVRALEKMLDSRPTAPKPTPQSQRRPGRPRKAERDNTHSASA